MARILFSAVVASLCLCSRYGFGADLALGLGVGAGLGAGFGGGLDGGRGLSAGGGRVLDADGGIAAGISGDSSGTITLTDPAVQGIGDYVDFVNSMSSASYTFQTQANQTADQALAQLNQVISQLKSALKSDYELLGRLCAEQQTQAIAALKIALTQLATTLALARTARAAILYNCTSSGRTSTSATGSCTGGIISGVGSSNPLNVSQTIGSTQLTDALNQANNLFNDSLTFIATNANNAAVTANTNFQSLVNDLADADSALQNQTITTGAQGTAVLNQVQSSLMAAQMDATTLASDLAAQGQTVASAQAQNLANQIQTTLTTVQTAQGSLTNSGALSIDGSGISNAFTYVGSVSSDSGLG